MRYYPLCQRVFRGFRGKVFAQRWALKRAEIEGLKSVLREAAVNVQRAYRGHLGRVEATEVTAVDICFPREEKEGRSMRASSIILFHFSLCRFLPVKVLTYSPYLFYSRKILVLGLIQRTVGYIYLVHRSAQVWFCNIVSGASI